MSLKFGLIRPRTVELAALEGKEKSPYTYYAKNEKCRKHSVPLFLNGSCSFLQVTRTFDEFEFPPDPTTDNIVSCH